MKTVVTGGAGFIGANLCRHLLAHDDIDEVVAFDNLSNGRVANLDGIGATFVEGDITDPDALDQAFDGADAVVHLAALGSVPRSIADPITTHHNNATGTLELLQAARRAGDIHTLVASSSSVYGSTPDLPKHEALPTRPISPYAVSKLATEHLAHNYHKQFGLPTVAIRPFNIYGPGQVGEGAVHAFVVRALRNDPITIHNEGDQIRSWCYIDDIVDGIEQSMENDAAIGETFNIGNARSTVTIYQLARLIVRLANSSSELSFVPWDFADVELRIPDIKKAKDLLGYDPKVDLEDGLLRTIEWYRARN